MATYKAVMEGTHIGSENCSSVNKERKGVWKDDYTEPRWKGGMKNWLGGKIMILAWLGLSLRYLARHPSRNVHRSCRSTTPERHELLGSQPCRDGQRAQEEKPWERRKGCSPGESPGGVVEGG